MRVFGFSFFFFCMLFLFFLFAARGCELPCSASAALIILPSVVRTAGFPLTDCEWLIVPPPCFLLEEPIKQFNHPEAFSFLLNSTPEVLTVTISAPVRWTAPPGTGSPPCRRKRLTPGLWRLLLLLSMACDEAWRWQRSWAEAVLDPSETCQNTGACGSGLSRPPLTEVCYN